MTGQAQGQGQEETYEQTREHEQEQEETYEHEHRDPHGDGPKQERDGGHENGSRDQLPRTHAHGPEGPQLANPIEFWEQLYAGAAPVWSGKVNRTLAETVADWAPGRSLDLGCGEGGDVLWLAARGWNATGIDLSHTAVARARQAASEQGIENAHFVAHDLAEWVERGDEVDGIHGPLDLITASFLQSPVELPRESILQAALVRLAPGGRLVLISHAAPPPWSTNEGVAGGHSPRQEVAHTHDHGSGRGSKNSDDGPKFFTPDEELEMLSLEQPGDENSTESGSPSLTEYAVIVAEVRAREVKDPEGNPSLIDDSIVVVRRSGGPR